MKLSYFDNSLETWSVALAGFILIFSALLIVRKFSLKRFTLFSKSTVTLADDLIYKLVSVTKTYFLAASAIYVMSFTLALSPATRVVLSKSFLLICLMQASSWGSLAIAFWIENYLKKRSLSDTATATSIGLISFSTKFALYSILVLLAVHNLGFNVTTLIAGLGVGGIAVALAVQNILGDLFASLTIVLDKPFVVGDFIVVGDFMGTLEHIGLKTTRIRSLSGEQLIFSNSDLLQSRVRNFKRMSERRVSFSLGVIYQTSSEQLSRIPTLIKEIVSAVPNTRFERCHFLKFGTSSLDVETVYWVLNPDYGVYADIAQQVNLEIFRRFGAEGIQFAYPTQTLFIQKNAESQDRTSADQ
ncbi:MAG TPA: mechanosensitive ion channel protein MscS [Bdellovibrionales bacterium]|nr:MAG: hypothetical protein A2Z97_13925 [Bdellovibrionales bacterium GWB1_52_6]OFZ06400.1 MAG: hypothetical protein A2X97_02975 [Bdellovibrionales bacterium GWA1_52_35]OFZ39952.1 MAG: hypothetical protein A2070_07870 [Bdellovibrionales bacterium GWC1_52_8]HAR43877.1 mechanosensitive ion channel protein MscS [Bdellovibrionales bacterium]HCM40156.1 mechanosensitive ion channel protein MscS [Bdellovibrionales bacterium]